METVKHFLKGIVAGIGGIAPGLSGSVLLVIMGLYEKTINALGTLFKHFKKNVKFLLPVGLGMVLGVLLFSKVVDFRLDQNTLRKIVVVEKAKATPHGYPRPRNLPRTKPL